MGTHVSQYITCFFRFTFEEVSILSIYSPPIKFEDSGHFPRYSGKLRVSRKISRESGL
jgi:hypothetical protein